MRGINEKKQKIKLSKKEILLLVGKEIGYQAKLTRKFIETLVQRPKPIVEFEVFQVKMSERGRGLVDFEWEVEGIGRAEGTCNFWLFWNIMDGLREEFAKKNTEKRDD